MSANSAPIVVGVDGTEASLAALRWAVGEAAAHDVELIAVHVRDPRPRPRAPYAGGEVDGAGPAGAARLVERQVERIEAVKATPVFEVGNPSVQLVRRAIGARMLVLGLADGRRHGDGIGMQFGPTLGPVARACVARASCPVVVVPSLAREPAREAAAPPVHRVQHAPLAGGRAIYAREEPSPAARR